ncbi:hypothetical protein RvY_12433 [Ramazzottius varieornatus]|uniref:Chitin-binding type-2 domain-containing protein n=1 Tax=Ramazzottius varieornatus TaxID=947166 RepID=A0A1D1VJH5_RAMVA|nr:hypothetical protein RvY_12433 [Ramazzottius varieornatus]
MIIFCFPLVLWLLALLGTEAAITSRRSNTPSGSLRSSADRSQPRNGQRLVHRLRRPGPRMATGLKQNGDGQPSLAHFARSFPFPTYATPPQTSFSCSNVNLPGFYADPETQCQVIRRCTLSNYMFSYICPNGTVFDQAAQGCAYWYNVNCPREVQQLNQNQIPVPLVAVPEGVSAPDFQLRSSFGPGSTSSRLPTFLPTKTPIDNWQRRDASPNAEDGSLKQSKLPWLPSRDPRFPTGQNRPEILGGALNQPNPSPKNLQSQATLDAKAANQRDNATIKTLMQWVGANPVWVPRQDQLQHMPPIAAPTPSQTSLPWTASAIAPDKEEEVSTRKPSRTVVVNLAEKEPDMESAAGDGQGQSSQAKQPTAVTSLQNDVNDVDGNVVSKQGAKKSLNTSVVNNRWHPLTDFG